MYIAWTTSASADILRRWEEKVRSETTEVRTRRAEQIQMTRNSGDHGSDGQ